jgi:pimeloyl-ACP methyl ester carboxylesterase
MHRRNILAATAASIGAVLSLSARASGRPVEGRRPASFITARDGAELFCRDVGEGRPIIFVAAWALNSLAWQYQMLPLARAGFRCIAYDRRSHGRSSDPGRGYEIDTLADDLASVMDGFGLEDAVLVGHSMGAAEIIRYLTRHGTRRVRGLVLIAPTTPFMKRTADNPEGIDPAISEAVRVRAAQDFPGIVAANIKPFFVATTTPAMVDWIAQMMTDNPLHALLACSLAFSNADFRDALPEIALPTLILHGDADASNPLPLTGRKTAALMPNSELKVYEGAPHGLIFTHMERVNADITTFAAKAL